MNEIKINDQVIYKHPNHRLRTKTLKLGQVVSIDAAKGEAMVVFPADNSKQSVRLDELESVKNRFSGRAWVNPHALLRGIS
jgi:hypothetical protein